ncbi:hypothetical protein OHC33_001576 [Knufia fluminis]|uniref:Fungal N-terminal domain-containing protein n=1 Tax=Knufia fluminis TaxID=191047 RepID=A0AAN8EMV8_9EURO|nr:hypothetical protein OHC33_001576 [Knufia fluminis]
MAHSQANDTVRLAGQAATLSSELYSVQEKCQHETTAGEISTIADELARLSTTLWHLNDAINSDPTQYTDAFNEDLREITTELTSVFEEISECCAGLQIADSNGSAVAWFFKKGRVARLLKHLEALKGTLVVMRTVLWHGKDYGTHKSDRIAESSPHTMHEDRMILESVLARNRNAILDLHNLTNTGQSAENLESHTLERKPSRAGDHYRQLSEATGVEIPPIPDVLPPTSADKQESENRSTPPSSLRRTFSKRGVRLGVHMSILDLSAHEAPSNLKQKWIQHANLRQQHGHGQSGDRRGLTALPELSRISEVDTAAGSSHDLRLPQPPPEPIIPEIPESPSAETPAKDLLVPYNTPADSSPVTFNDPYPRKGRSFTVGSKLRHVMSKLSMSNLRSPARSRSHGRGSSEFTSKSSNKGKEKEDTQDGSDEISPTATRTRPGPLNIDQENNVKVGRRPFLEVIKQRFERSPLTTPDIEKEFEYGRYAK